MSDEQETRRNKGGGYRPSNKPKCGAKLRGKDQTCKKHPLKDQKRCQLHGGKAPRAQAKAAEVQAERKLRKVLDDLEITPIENPLTALAGLAGEVVRWKELLASRVGAMESLGYSGENGEQIKAEVQLYERSMDRAVSVLDKIARLDIDGRLAAIDEQRALMVEKAIEAAFDALDLPLDQRQRAWGAVAIHLRSHSQAG